MRSSRCPTSSHARQPRGRSRTIRPLWIGGLCFTLALLAAAFDPTAPDALRAQPAEPAQPAKSAGAKADVAPAAQNANADAQDANETKPADSADPVVKTDSVLKTGSVVKTDSVVKTKEARPGERGMPAGKKYRKAVRIHFEGEITPFLQQQLERRLEAAKDYGADLIILEIDSPGGLVEESFAIAERLHEINWAHVVAYIPKQALSGASFVALGCDEIIMDPEARIGDAGPIILDQFMMFQYTEDKVVSDIARRLQILADAHGRSATLAEAMVDRNLEVFEIENKITQEKRYVSQRELDHLPNRDEWGHAHLVAESRAGRFLEVSGKRALELKIVEGNAESLAAVQERLALQDPPLLLTNTWVDGLVYFLNSCFVSTLLILFGLLFFYLELHSPGIGVFGILALVCFALFFWSRVLGGTAGALEIVLFVLGLGCLLLEIFVIPGFGVTGISGLLLLLASLLLASQTHVIPTGLIAWRTLAINLGVLTSAGLLFSASVFTLSHYLGSLPLLGRIVLQPPAPEEQPEPPMAAKTLAIGQVGKTLTSLRPAGKARFGELYLEVVADDDIIPRDREIEIIAIQGSRIVVRLLS